MAEELDQALSRSTEAMTNKWIEFESKQLDMIAQVAQRIGELKVIAERTPASTAASSAPVPAEPDTQQWARRSNIRTIPSVALLISDVASWS